MKKVYTKTLLLILLILVSLSQIQKLWFDSNSNHGFFTFALKQEKSKLPSHSRPYFYPVNIAFHTGQKPGEYLQVNKSNILFGDISRDILRGLELLAGSNPSLLEDQEDFDIYTRPHISLMMPENYKMKDFYQAIGYDKPTGQEEIKQIIMVPARLEDSFFHLLVYGARGESLAKLKLDKKKLQTYNQAFLDYMKNTEFEKKAISSKYLGIEKINNNVLLPLKERVYTNPRLMEWTIPFVADGEISTGDFKEYVIRYSKNPYLLWQLGDENQVRLGDGKIVATYNKQGDFNYELVTRAEDKQAISVGSAYEKAKEFLDRDSLLLKQEYSIARHEEIDGLHYFYYNYYFRDIPIVVDKGYPMQVVVSSQGVISYYRKLMVLDDVLKMDQAYQLFYGEAMDEFYKDQPRTRKIDNIFIGYKMLDNGQIKLSWIVDSGDIRWAY